MENPMQPAPPPPPGRRLEKGNPHPPPQKCPRCDSSNTKFCYYNNYSLAQPRYFCKVCRRYWTQGGTLRNVPVGGVYRRRTRRLRSSDARASAIAGSAPPEANHAFLRAPIMPVIGNGGHFFAGGAYLSHFVAGVNPGDGPPNFGGGQYDTGSIEILQPPNGDQMFPPPQGLGRPSFSPWAQSFMRGSSSVGSRSGFWEEAAGENGDQPSSRV